MTERRYPIESHETHSHRLMRHAYEELDKGDRLQASEKAWGAVAHRLKTIAGTREWRYVTHSDAYNIIDRLRHETGDPMLRTLFAVANGLHQNYYMDAVPLHEIRQDISEVEELLKILDGIE